MKAFLAALLLSASVCLGQSPLLSGGFTIPTPTNAIADGSVIVATGPQTKWTTTLPPLSYATNLTTLAPNFNLPVSLITTNAAFTLLAPINVDTTKTLYQFCTMFITNSTAAAVAITAPSGVRTVGTLFVTNLTRIDFEQYGQKFTNAYFMPIF